jgi:hypothetical protein
LNGMGFFSGCDSILESGKSDNLIVKIVLGHLDSLGGSQNLLVSSIRQVNLLFLSGHKGSFGGLRSRKQCFMN